MAEAAALAGINLIHRFHLTLPPETKVLGSYAANLDGPPIPRPGVQQPEVLDTDLRHLARLGLGSDVTEWYLALEW